MKVIQYLFISLLLFSPIFLFAQNRLYIPDTLTGNSMQLSLQRGEVEFFQGHITNTLGYNQDILGPTIVLHKYQDVTLHVNNQLSEPTTLHWHGLHVSPKNDGGPHTVIEPGLTWSPSFTVLDHAATYWYHPHLHEHTEEQVTMGASGFIIVRDDQESDLLLPRTYGVDDFPVVIQSKAFDANYQLLHETPRDKYILCNGTLDPFVEIPAQVIRLRLLNGSTERVYNIGIEGNRTFYQIATDGGLVEKPIELSRLMLSPGERGEILIDLSGMENQNINLTSYNSELNNGIYGASNASAMPIGNIAGYNENPLNGADFNLIELRIQSATANAVHIIPDSLVASTSLEESDANTTRDLLFQPEQMGPFGMTNGPFVINGASFDFDEINFKVPLDNIEIWELTNMTAISHPFHIHDVQFYILDINGNPPTPPLQGRKDVVLVPPMFGTVRFITQFEDFADDETPYMYHCHMLSHEDQGMMGQFIVYNNATNINEENEEHFTIHPNPVSNSLYLEGQEPSLIELYNISGHLLESRKFLKPKNQIDMAKYTSGIYFIKLTTSTQSQTQKIVKK
jgi:bilirubin oxidase